MFTKVLEWSDLGIRQGSTPGPQIWTQVRAEARFGESKRDVVLGKEGKDGKREASAEQIPPGPRLFQLHAQPQGSGVDVQGPKVISTTTHTINTQPRLSRNTDIDQFRHCIRLYP